MTIVATTWLAFGLMACSLAWFAIPGRLGPIALVVTLLFGSYAIGLPLGHPTPEAPPAGKYTVLGARIDVGEAIYVLLDSGQGEPRYYVLPHSSGKANELQNAMDAAGGQPGGVEAEIDASGEPAFHAAPVTDGPPKVDEQPAFEVP